MGYLTTRWTKIRGKGPRKKKKRGGGGEEYMANQNCHLFCDPLGSGHPFHTHHTVTPGIALKWYHSPKNDSWHEVFHGNQLQPGIYGFDPTQPIIFFLVCLYTIRT